MRYIYPMRIFRPLPVLLFILLIFPASPALRSQSPGGDAGQGSPLPAPGAPAGTTAPGPAVPAAGAASVPAAELLRTDPASLIGLNLENLLSRFGAPQGVYAARGDEAWQDDVVFAYTGGDFYIYRDRVWQIRLKDAYGVRQGDPRPAVSLTLGEEAEDFGDHLILALPSKGWPLALRVNLDGAGIVAAVYVYRPDF
jgi:hypothetical protein